MGKESGWGWRGGDSYDQYWGGHKSWGQWAGGYRRHLFNPEADLAALKERLLKYDELRLELETKGGVVSQLTALGELLKAPLLLGEETEAKVVKLCEPEALKQALQDLHWDLRLEVRFKPSHLPVYYLCRGKSDYWSEYSLVVEDYHLSPGYPLVDERFVKLMQGGHEKHFLRLSHLRQGAAALMTRDGSRPPDSLQMDDALHDLGRHVFQAAWHQDQQMGMLAARHFGLPAFAQAVELLYLCLSGELCELRGAVNGFMGDFFRSVYPQPAIAAFLDLLPGLEGKQLNDLPRRALALYASLGRAFALFLNREVVWGEGRAQGALPLWKLVYANMHRLDLIAGPLRAGQALTEAGAALEAQALQVTEALLEAAEGRGGDGRQG